MAPTMPTITTSALSVTNLGWVQLASRGGTLAHDLIVRGGIGRDRYVCPITLAQVASPGLGSSQPPQAEAEHNDRRMPSPGAASGVVPKNGIGMAF